MLSSPIPFPNAGLKATVLFLSFHPLLFGPRRNPSHQLILYLLFDSMKTVFKISLQLFIDGILLVWWFCMLVYFGVWTDDGVPDGVYLFAMVLVGLPLQEVGVEVREYPGFAVHSNLFVLCYNNTVLLSTQHYNSLMEQDPVILTLLKLKRQNEEITAQKEKINDLKTIKRIKKAAELNEAIEKYKEIEEALKKLQEDESNLLDEMKKLSED